MPSQALLRRFCTLPLIAAALVWLGTAGPARAATINVTCSGGNPSNCTNNLNTIFEGAASGDTVIIGPGTYTAMAGSAINPAAWFYINKQLTVVSSAGAASTILRANTAAADYVVHIYHSSGTAANGTTLEGFTLQNAYGGVQVMDFPTGGNTAISNVTLRSLIVTSSNPNDGANGSHGVHFENVIGSRLDAVTVNSARHNGIYVNRGSGNVLTSNTVVQTVIQHAIGLQNTSGNVVSGNTITGSGFHGIIGVGMSNSRIERNSISGVLYDGITLTKDTGAGVSSVNNVIAHNTITQPGWAAGTSDGTGIWLNGDSNGNYVFGNNTRGAPENGISIFGGSYNYLHANRVHGNYEGGILIWNEPSAQSAGGSQPTRTLVRNNFVYYNPQNAMVNLRDTVNTDVAFNHFWGANFPGEPTNPTHPRGNTGATYTASPGGVATSTYAANATSVYENAMSGLVNAIFFDVGVQNSSVYRNKFFGLGGTGIMDFTAITGAGVVWDAGAVMGGNYFQGHSANGNPSNGATPFTDIYCPGPSGCNQRDNYPFASETLGKSYSVSVTLPRSGSQVAAGSIKTIEWRSKGCALVDIELMNGVSVVTTIASNYPDVGYFIWNVSASETTGARTVRVTCNNSSGDSVGIAGLSGSFTVYASGLTLLTPGPFSKMQRFGSATVAWKRGAGVTGAVNVFISTDGGAETSLASNVTGNHAVVTLPVVITNRAVIRVTTTTGTNQDSTDGYFSILDTFGQQFTAPTSGTSVAFGDRLKFEWSSHINTRYVDIEVHNGSSYVLVAQNVPDVGSFEWHVTSAYIGSNRTARITFKTGALATIAQITSQNFNVTAATDVDLSISQTLTPIKPDAGVNKDVIVTIAVSNAGPGSASNVVVTDTIPAGSTFIWASPGCLFSAGTVTCQLGTMASGSGNSLTVVWRPTSTGSKTNQVAISSSSTDVNSGNNSSSANITINAIPAATPVLRYRLYSDISKEHHFTTDLNEYNVLGTMGWQQEGTVGKVLNQPGSYNGVTAVPYYRLYDNSTTWHHWTTDANEYYTLRQYPWWSAEGVDGWILPTSGGAGTTELFRLNYSAIPTLHHWTIDAYEYSQLICCYGWSGEGGAGFVIQ